MFNNAGIMDSRDDNAQVTEEEVWDLTMAINLKGFFLDVNLAFLQCRELVVVLLLTLPLLWG